MKASTRISVVLVAIALALTLLPMTSSAQTGVLYVKDDNVGIGTDSPSGKLHVSLGGTTFVTHPSTSMALQNTTTSTDGVILSLIGGNGTNGNGQLVFGDTDSEFRGRVVYDHSTLDRFRFFTGGAWVMKLNNRGSTPNLIELSNGATLTSGGVWTNSSSRANKDNINALSTPEAVTAIMGMEPVTFSYKANPTEDHVGFIAEDVPDLVATNDREGLSPMDVVAVLTKVVQHQQETIERQEEAIAELASRLNGVEGH